MYKTCITKKRVVVMEVCTWVSTAVINTIIKVLAYKPVVLDRLPCAHLVTTTRTQFLVGIALNIFIPCAIIIISYFCIFKKVRQFLKGEMYRNAERNRVIRKMGNKAPDFQVNDGKSNGSEKRINAKGLLKAGKTVLFPVFYLLTSSPYVITSFIYLFGTPQNEQFSVLKIGSYLGLLGYTNYFINPLLYAWWHNGFRRNMKEIWRVQPNRCNKLAARVVNKPTVTTVKEVFNR